MTMKATSAKAEKEDCSKLADASAFSTTKPKHDLYDQQYHMSIIFHFISMTSLHFLSRLLQ